MRYPDGKKIRIQVAIGNRIRMLRLEAGLSQRQLAEVTGIHISQIGKMEEGINPPNVHHLLEIAGVLEDVTGRPIDITDLVPVITDNEAAE